METLNTYNPKDIIPAFLAPDHIINHDHTHSDEKNTAKNQNIRDTLHRALKLNSVNIFAQPVVTLPQRKTAFIEIFGRLNAQPGAYIPAQDFMIIANEEHLINRLDTLVLTNALRFIRKQKYKNIVQGYFINIKPYTLRNGVFMNRLVKELSDTPDLSRLLIFEMSHSDFMMLSPAEIKILHALAGIGCRFSLDHMANIPDNVPQLHAGYISFVKIKASTLIKEGHDDEGFKSVINKKRILDVNGIHMIIEHIENEHAVLDALDYNIGYGQGFLFGKPDFQSVYVPRL